MGAARGRPDHGVPFGERWAEVVPAVRVDRDSALPILLVFVAWATLLARHQVRPLAVGSVPGTVLGLVTSIVLVARRPEPLSAVIGTGVGATVAVVLLFGLRDVLGAEPKPSVEAA